MLQERFHALDGYALACAGRRPCSLASVFGKEDWGRQTDEFSGGWQMRIALGQAICWPSRIYSCSTRPTNHLDLETPQLARGLSKNLSLWLHSDLPRPLLSRRHHRPHRGDMNKRLNIYQGN